MREVTGRSAVNHPESKVTDLSSKERNLEAGLKKGAVELGKLPPCSSTYCVIASGL